MDGLDEIKDRVACSVLLRRGEDVWNENFGIDYTALANLSPLARSHIPAAILAHITSLEGVTAARLVLQELDVMLRRFNLTIEIDTVEGTATIET